MRYIALLSIDSNKKSSRRIYKTTNQQKPTASDRLHSFLYNLIAKESKI